MRFIVLLLALSIAGPACVRAFASKDLAGVARPAADALGPGFIVKAEKRRLTLVCDGCAGAPVVDLRLGRQTDGTEERVRSGSTAMADLERLCRARDPACRLSALDVSPAVGWVTGYTLGRTAGATAVIIRDGDLLTVRSLAGDPATARANIDKLLPVVRARIVGR